MKVLHIITGLGIGGADQQLRLLMRHLDAECEVITLTEDGPLADEIRAEGVPVTRLRMEGNRDLRALPRLAALIRAGRYDIVHTHLYRACVYGRIAARLAGVRTVLATEHTLGVTRIDGRPLGFGARALYRTSERLGHGTFAVSDPVAHRLEALGLPAARVHVAPNGVDSARFRFDPDARARTRSRLGIPKEAYVAGGVGRQVQGQHFDLLIRAVAETAGMYLVLSGDGPERVPLLRLVHALGVQDRVKLTDSVAVPGAAPLMSAMDLFVSPSTEEAFGLPVVEALASGLPALYVSCPAVEDLPPEHAPGARRVEPVGLVTALREAHLAGPRRLPVPAAVEQYDIARTAEHIQTLYTRIAGRRRLLRRATQPAPVPRPAREADLSPKAASTPAQATAPDQAAAPSAAATLAQPPAQASDESTAQPAAKK